MTTPFSGLDADLQAVPDGEGTGQLREFHGEFETTGHEVFLRHRGDVGGKRGFCRRGWVPAWSAGRGPNLVLRHHATGLALQVQPDRAGLERPPIERPVTVAAQRALDGGSSKPAATKSWWMPILSGRGCSQSKQAGYASVSAGRTVAARARASVRRRRDWGRSWQRLTRRRLVSVANRGRTARTARASDRKSGDGQNWRGPLH